MNVFLSVRNYATELYAFSKRLGEELEDSLLRRALTERSYMLKLEEDTKKVGIIATPEDQEEVLDNLQLVPKGEEILTDVVVRYLRHLLPRLPEEGIQLVFKISYNLIIFAKFHKLSVWTK